MKSYVASLGLRSCLCCLTRLIYTWSKKGLCRPYATPVLHKMQLTPQREFTRHIFYTPNLQIWMLKMKKKKIRSQNNPTAAIAALQQQTCSSNNKKQRNGSRKAMYANYTIYKDLQSHVTVNAIILYEEACVGIHKNHLEFLISNIKVRLFSYGIQILHIQKSNLNYTYLCRNQIFHNPNISYKMFFLYLEIFCFLKFP